MSMAKKRIEWGGMVVPADEMVPCEEQETLAPSAQKLHVRYERAGRGGKEVTLVQGFVGKPEDLKELATKLKQRLGCGGSAKDGEIVLQGDRRSALPDVLRALGYSSKKQ